MLCCVGCRKPWPTLARLLLREVSFAASCPALGVVRLGQSRLYAEMWCARVGAAAAYWRHSFGEYFACPCCVSVLRLSLAAGRGGFRARSLQLRGPGSLPCCSVFSWPRFRGESGSGTAGISRPPTSDGSAVAVAGHLSKTRAHMLLAIGLMGLHTAFAYGSPILWLCPDDDMLAQVVHASAAALLHFFSCQAWVSL